MEVFNEAESEDGYLKPLQVSDREQGRGPNPTNRLTRGPISIYKGSLTQRSLREYFCSESAAIEE